MAEALSVDTSFLIDLERERRREEEGPAHRFLARNRRMELCLPSVALGELVEGYGDPGHPALWAIRRSHRVLWVDEEVAVRYGTLARALRAGGQLLGSNDMWIAATALQNGQPLLTADADAFGRVDELSVISYR